MSEVMMKAMQIRIESLERQVRQLTEENAGVRGCLTEFDKRHDADQASMAKLAEALTVHHRWHLEQDQDANEWGIDPVDAYSGSGLCEMTCAALASVDGKVTTVTGIDKASGEDLECRVQGEWRDGVFHVRRVLHVYRDGAQEDRL